MVIYINPIKYLLHTHYIRIIFHNSHDVQVAKERCEYNGYIILPNDCCRLSLSYIIIKIYIPTTSSHYSHTIYRWVCPKIVHPKSNGLSATFSLMFHHFPE
jgi:tRNA G26 N,N-dimethylase Trm1